MRCIHINFFTSLLIAATVAAGCSGDRIDSSAHYLGQTPPGLKAQMFAPGIVSTVDARDRDICFSADFSVLYFTRNAQIMTVRRKGGRWGEPKPAAFGSDFPEYETCLSPDNQRVYFISRRPLSGGEEPEDFQIWTASRAGDDWTKPERLTDAGDYYPSITSSGVMYFTDTNDDIWRSRLVEGRMSEREKLGDSVNTDASEYNAMIAPDESYLIFTSLGGGDGFGGPDLFISFRSADDRWTTPRNMGLAVNSSGLEYCPTLSPDRKYLFFTRRDGKGENVYWIDAAIVDTLRNLDLDVSLGLYHAVVTEGPDRAAENYARVRKDFAAYRDFDGDLLSGLAERLLGNGRSDEAAAVIRLGFELHPASATDLQRLKLAAIEDDRASFDATAEKMKLRAEDGAGDEALTNMLGYHLVGWGMIEAAIKVLELNVELFPESGNVYDSYAEVLLMKGDTARSIENYHRSLEKDPENENAQMMLKRLGSE